MSIFHDEIEIEDFEYDEEEETYYYPCPCGDRFQISKVNTKVRLCHYVKRLNFRCFYVNIIIKTIFSNVSVQNNLIKMEKFDEVLQKKNNLY